MNIRWNSILTAVALILLACYYIQQQDKEDLSVLIKQDEQPEYIGQMMRTTAYTPEGKKQYHAQAERIEHYKATGETVFIRPELYLLNTQVSTLDNQSWKIRADHAKLDNDNTLYLQGNVRVDNLVPNSHLQHIETEQAVINIQTQDISSPSAVKISGQNFTSTGLKLTGNLQQQVATLQEQVKTFYEIRNP